MESAEPSTTAAGHAPTPSTSSSTAQPSSSKGKGKEPALELDYLEPQHRTTDGAGSQAPLSDVSIPTTSPITSLFPPTSTSAMSESTPNPTSSTEESKPEASSSSTAGPSSDPEIKSHTAPATTTSSAAAEPSSSLSITPQIQRLDSVAIGPSTDDIEHPKETTVTDEAGPVLLITLLIPSGARHPYKLDDKYLTKRNVNAPLSEFGKKDPFSISVYTLKELILREWRDEWETQPTSPSSIRLIYFGRFLDDKTALKGESSFLSSMQCRILPKIKL